MSLLRLVAFGLFLLVTPMFTDSALAEPFSLELRRAAGGTPSGDDLARTIPYGLGLVTGASLEGSFPAGRNAEHDAVAGVDTAFFGLTLRDERNLLLVSPEGINRVGIFRPEPEDLHKVTAENSEVGVRAIGQYRGDSLGVDYLLRHGQAPAFQLGLDWSSGLATGGFEYGYRRSSGRVRVETEPRLLDIDLSLERHRYGVSAGIEPVRLSLLYASADLEARDRDVEIAALSRTVGATLRAGLPRTTASAHAAVTQFDGVVREEGRTYGAIDELFLYHGWSYVNVLVLPRTTLSLHGDAARVRLSGENHISTAPFFDMAGYYPIRLLRVAGEGTAFVPGIMVSHEGLRRGSGRSGKISWDLSGSLRGFHVAADYSFLKRRYTLYPFFTYDSISGDPVDVRGVFARLAGRVDYERKRFGLSLQLSQYLPIWSEDRSADESSGSEGVAPVEPEPVDLAPVEPAHLRGMGIQLTARFRLR